MLFMMIFIVFISLTGVFISSIPVMTTSWEFHFRRFSSPWTVSFIAWRTATIAVTACLTRIEAAWWSVSSPSRAVFPVSATRTSSSTNMVMVSMSRTVLLFSGAWAWTSVPLPWSFSFSWLMLLTQLNIVIKLYISHDFISFCTDFFHNVCWDWRYTSYGTWSRIQIQIYIVTDSSTRTTPLIWNVDSDLHRHLWCNRRCLCMWKHNWRLESSNMRLVRDVCELDWSLWGHSKSDCWRSRSHLLELIRVSRWAEPLLRLRFLLNWWLIVICVYLD